MVGPRRLPGAALALALATAACQATVPPTIPPASPTAATPNPATPTLTIGPTASSAPATPGPTSAPPTPPALAVTGVDLQFLERASVPGSELRSAAGQVIWSGGPRTSTQVWRFLPGSPDPELVVDVRRRGSTISNVVASAAGYAFVEVNGGEFGLGGWRIWFVEGPGDEPVELDRGLAYGAGFPPTLAMDDERIAWAAFDEPPSGDISTLRTIAVDDIGTPGAVRTLIELPVREGLLWLPDLHGDELWYAILRPDWDGTQGGDEFHIETLDIRRPETPAVRFTGNANDFNPVVSDAHVAWKTQVSDGAALNWGTVTVMDRAGFARREVPMANLNWPSLGRRFLTFEEITRRRLAVFDLARHELVDLRPDSWSHDRAIGGQSISGSLLAFYIQDGAGAPRIGWAVLPE